MAETIIKCFHRADSVERWDSQHSVGGAQNGGWAAADIGSLRVGDTVKSCDRATGLPFGDVVTFVRDHAADGEAPIVFQTIELKSGNRHRVTPEHHVWVGDSVESACRMPARDARPGMKMAILNADGTLGLAEIASATAVAGNACDAFQVYTASMTMIVNGVHASCYTEHNWFTLAPSAFEACSRAFPRAVAKTLAYLNSLV